MDDFLWGEAFYFAVQVSQLSSTSLQHPPPRCSTAPQVATCLQYSSTVQAGASVGFGGLSDENEGSRVYTIFYVLVGSSFCGPVAPCTAASSLIVGPSAPPSRWPSRCHSRSCHWLWPAT
jgi:hypothetical protein